MKPQLKPLRSYEQYLAEQDEAERNQKEALTKFWQRERERKRWYKLPDWVALLSAVIVGAAAVYLFVILWLASPTWKEFLQMFR